MFTKVKVYLNKFHSVFSAKLRIDYEDIEKVLIHIYIKILESIYIKIFLPLI